MFKLLLGAILTSILATSATATADDPKPSKQETGKPAATVTEPDLRQELLTRMKEDQDIRFKMIDVFRRKQGGDKSEHLDKEEKAIAEKCGEIDTKNTAWMKEVIAKYGWPGFKMVGKDGELAAFLLVQHADRDPAFQRKCLDILAVAVKRGEGSGTHLAYLTDRVYLAEGKKQIYGTQLHMVDGQLQPRPIEDEAKVDERRKAVGLEALAKYVERVRETQSPKQSK